MQGLYEEEFDLSMKTNYDKIRDIMDALYGIELKNKAMAFSNQWPVTSMIVMSSLKILRKIHDKENEFKYSPTKRYTLTTLHLDLVFNSFDKINYLENFQKTCDFNRP